MCSWLRRFWFAFGRTLVTWSGQVCQEIMTRGPLRCPQRDCFSPEGSGLAMTHRRAVQRAEVPPDGSRGLLPNAGERVQPRDERREFVENAVLADEYRGAGGERLLDDVRAVLDRHHHHDRFGRHFLDVAGEL